MFCLLIFNDVNGLGHHSGQFLDIVVVDSQIIKVHDEQVEDFLLLDIVSTHLVERLLGLQDEIYQVKNLKPVVDVKHQLFVVDNALCWGLGRAGLRGGLGWGLVKG
jgi:hypothetical protein